MLADAEVLHYDIFKKIKDNEKAQEIEGKSRDSYLEKADEVKSKSQKEIFLKIAEEERKHYEILEKIIAFVSQPRTWLEDAEWYHVEEY